MTYKEIETGFSTLEYIYSYRTFCDATRFHCCIFRSIAVENNHLHLFIHRGIYRYSKTVRSALFTDTVRW